MDLRKDFIAAARGWLNVPFLHQGREKDRGIDCVGLVIQSAREVGLTTVQYRNYSRSAQPAVMRNLLRKHCVPVVRPRMLPSDILWMRLEKLPYHVAIFTFDGTIIHSYSGVGKVVEHRLDDKWSKRIVEVYRFPQFTELAGVA